MTFTGEHKDGDLLVVSEFTSGGTVSTINVYRWDGGDATGVAGQPTPVANGVDCRDDTLRPERRGLRSSEHGGDHHAVADLPKPERRVGHRSAIARVLRGRHEPDESDLGGKCFSTFLGDTRSSTSLTATLFDFAGGTIGSCETTLTTTAGINGPTTTIDGSNTAANGTASSGIDNATLTVSGVDEWDGSLKFYLCGPMPTVDRPVQRQRRARQHRHCRATPR